MQLFYQLLDLSLLLFFASTFISWRLGANLISASLVSLAISVTIFVLFRYVLGLSLAVGPLGF